MICAGSLLVKFHRSTVFLKNVISFQTLHNIVISIYFRSVCPSVSPKFSKKLKRWPSLLSL